jgi:radical SAM-linked protein
MTRVRLIYEKRWGACFVPHVALATLFTRAARRAGIEPCPTAGFSPHARISLGPELPAGIVALWEPVDLWVREDVEKSAWREKAAQWLSMLNAQMPGGFRVRRCVFLSEDAPALGKKCEAAHYQIWLRRSGFLPEPELGEEFFLGWLRRYFCQDVLFAEISRGGECGGGSGEKEENGKNLSRISAVLASPAKNGLGGWIKALTAEGLVSGWQDFRVARVSMGRWNGAEKRLEPLTEEGVACLK